MPPHKLLPGPATDQNRLRVSPERHESCDKTLSGVNCGQDGRLPGWHQRRKGACHDPDGQIFVVYRKQPVGAADPERGGRMAGGFHLPSGARLCRNHWPSGDALCLAPPPQPGGAGAGPWAGHGADHCTGRRICQPRRLYPRVSRRIRAFAQPVARRQTGPDHPDTSHSTKVPDDNQTERPQDGNDANPPLCRAGAALYDADPVRHSGAMGRL